VRGGDVALFSICIEWRRSAPFDRWQANLFERWANFSQLGNVALFGSLAGRAKASEIKALSIGLHGTALALLRLKRRTLAHPT
jgi:hypothetical protein